MLTASCPHCHNKQSYPKSLSGKDTMCRRCGKSFTIIGKPEYSDYPPLGRLALEKGLISESQLSYALKVRDMGKALGKTHSLDNILYRLGFISLHTLHHLFAATMRQLDREFGEIALKKGILNQVELEKALDTQAREFKNAKLLQVGDILLSSGHITKEQYELVMFGYQNREVFQETYEKKSLHVDHETPDRKSDLMGQIAVESHFISQQQLEQVLEEMDREDTQDQTSLEKILLKKNLLSRDKLTKLITATERVLDRKFIAIALEKGLVTENQVHNAMEVQERELKKKGLRLISEILIDLKTITIDQCNEILRSQGRSEVDIPAKKAAKIKRKKQEHKLLSQLKQGVDFGKFVAQNNYISETQLLEALDILKNELNAGRKTSMDSVLVRKKMVEPEIITMLRMMKTVTDQGKSDKRFGEIATRLGLVDKHNVQEAFAKQIEEFHISKQIRSISEILVLRKHMRAPDVERVRRIMNGAEPPLPAARPLKREPDPAAFKTELFPQEITELKMVVAGDGLSATLEIPENIAALIDHEQLCQIASENGVTHGMLDKANFRKHLKAIEKRGGVITVARGNPPETGKDASINYHFEADFRIAGRVSDEGSIDFKSRGDVPHVEEGELLAEKIEMTPGKPGMDVFGRSLPVEDPKDTTITAGKNVSVSGDGLMAHAKLAGMPDADSGGKISVFPEYRVNGDVCLKTGHIVFDGNIFITGTVQEGYHVKGMHVTAGEIIGAEIHARGDVMVSMGVIDSSIKSERNVQARYVSGSRINAFGNIAIKKDILDSEIRVSGKCINHAGDIISSKIAARNGLDVNNVGTDVSQPCIIKAGVDEHVQDLLREISSEIRLLDKDLAKRSSLLLDLEKEQLAIQGNTARLVGKQEIYTRQEQTIKEDLEELGNIGDRDLIEIKRAELSETRKNIDKINMKVEMLFETDDALSLKIDEAREAIRILKDEIKDLEKRYEDVETWSRSQGVKSEIKVSGKMMEGTVLIGPHSKTVLDKPRIKVKLRERAQPNGSFKME